MRGAVAFLTGTIALAGCGPAPSPAVPPLVASTAAPDLPTPADCPFGFNSQPSNTAIQIGGLEYRFTDVREMGPFVLPLEETIVRPGPTSRLILVAYEIKNITDQPIDISTAPDVALLEATCQRYAPDPKLTEELHEYYRAYLNPPQVLNPDVTRRNAVLFEVSKQRFDARSWVVSVNGAQLFDYIPAPKPPKP